MEIPLEVSLPLNYFVKEEFPSALNYSVYTWKGLVDYTKEQYADLEAIYKQNFIYAGRFKLPGTYKDDLGYRLIDLNVDSVKAMPNIPKNLKDFLNQLVAGDKLQLMVAGLLIKYKFPEVFRQLVASEYSRIKSELLGPMLIDDTKVAAK